MANALNLVFDGFFIHNLAGTDADIKVESLFYDRFEDFGLHLPHKADVNRLQMGIPYKAELRVLLLKHLELRKHKLRVGIVRKLNIIGHNRLKIRLRACRSSAQALTAVCFVKACQRAHHTGCRLVDSFKLTARIEPYLADFLLADAVTHPESTARHLDMCQALALIVTADFENLTGKITAVSGFTDDVFKAVEEFVDALQFESRAKEARESLSCLCQLSYIFYINFALFQIFIQQILTAHGKLLVGIGHTKADNLTCNFAFQLMQNILRRITGEVHFRNEYDRRHVVKLKKLPQRACVRLHTVKTADDKDGIVEHLQYALGFGRKVHVSRCVKQGKMGVPKLKMSLTCKDSDAALTLKGMGIHSSVAFVNPAKRAQFACSV